VYFAVKTLLAGLRPFFRDHCFYKMARKRFVLSLGQNSCKSSQPTITYCAARANLNTAQVYTKPTSNLSRNAN